jgi:hypothetical protein
MVATILANIIVTHCLALLYLLWRVNRSARCVLASPAECGLFSTVCCHCRCCRKGIIICNVAVEQNALLPLKCFA